MFLIGSIRLTSLDLKRVNIIQLSEMSEMFDFISIFINLTSSNLLKTKDPNPSKVEPKYKPQLHVATFVFELWLQIEEGFNWHQS